MPPRRACLALLALALLAGAVPADDAPTPGLLARFSIDASSPPIAVQVVPDLSANWEGGFPDPRLPGPGFFGRWTGLLLIQTPGRHRFRARTDGMAALRINGRVAPPSDSIDLPAGFAALILEYTHTEGSARLALDWEGPGFGLEPVPARLFYHEPDDAAQPDGFEAGRRLADRLGCANCHRLLDLPAHPNLGPPLLDAGRAIERRWLWAWLRDPSAVRPRPRMPGVGHGFPPQGVADLVAFLEQVSSKPIPPTAELRMALNVAGAEKGRLLFRSLGCLGCHSRGEPVADDERAAPDLADLGRKRTEAWLAAFLIHPKGDKTPARHRPDFRLSADESAHLAAYLASDPPPAPDAPALPPGDPKRGRELADRARCASCHQIASLAPRAPDLPLGPRSRPDAGCLADAPGGPTVPRFVFRVEERRQLRDLVSRLPAPPSPSSPERRALDTIGRLNCLGCHARDGRGGQELGGRIAALLARDPALGGLKGTLTPPNLTAVGDKLRPDYLALAVRGAAPTARPWLSVRMPAFAFEPGEADAIASALRAHDRMRTDEDKGIEETHPDAATLERGTHLIGQRGFGCVSCHVVAGRIPPGGEPETLGPDLALAHRRMTARYFDRWIGNPQRIIAGTPMPQFVQPVATAPGTLAEQLATIWQLLGSPRAGEYAATGTRALLKRQGDQALVVRDMVLVPGAPETEYVPRGVALGLKNDCSLLFDADRLSWLAWWRGGFLSRTKSGRLWEWHPEGAPLWIAPNRGAPVVFRDRAGAIVPPTAIRDRFGAFTELDFEKDAVVLSYRLNGPGGETVRVRERIEPIEGGWERKVELMDVPDNVQPHLVERPPDMPVAAADRMEWSWTEVATRARLRLRVIESGPGRPHDPNEPEALLIPLAADAHGRFSARVRVEVRPAP